MDQRRADQNIQDLQNAARSNLRENVLMYRWQQGKDQVNSPELDTLLADSRKLHRILEALAYKAHKTQASVLARKADIQADDDETESNERQQPLRRGDLLVLLEDRLAGNTELANDFLDYIDHRAGLLVGRGVTNKWSLIRSGNDQSQALNL